MFKRRDNGGRGGLKPAIARSTSLFRSARNSYHLALLETGVLSTSQKGIPSNADVGSAASISIAKTLLSQIQKNVPVGTKLAGQISGNKFEQITKSFVERTFSLLEHLRPGRWNFTPQKRAISRFEQYKHLHQLEEIAEANPELATALGRDYIIAPDIVVIRDPEPDEAINKPQLLVDDTVALRASLRSKTGCAPILHASISCKWTIRSDRVQNARSEALNLIRNRKGRLPHIVVVTGDPLPSRLASIALGTGDIDCVYHFALPELMHAVKDMGDSADLIRMMVDGNRLKDITDLPLDLAV